jgi:hypothetical protein
VAEPPFVYPDPQHALWAIDELKSCIGSGGHLSQEEVDRCDGAFEDLYEYFAAKMPPGTELPEYPLRRGADAPSKRRR